jgi:hypothetical protein
VKDSRVCEFWLRGLDCRGCQCKACRLYRVDDRQALSQGFEPGHDPRNSATALRGTMFGQTRREWHADEAFFSIVDDEIRAVVEACSPGMRPPGADAVRSASYSAIAVESDRKTFDTGDVS